MKEFGLGKVSGVWNYHGLNSRTSRNINKEEEHAHGLSAADMHAADTDLNNASTSQRDDGVALDALEEGELDTLEELRDGNIVMIHGTEICTD